MLLFYYGIIESICIFSLNKNVYFLDVIKVRCVDISIFVDKKREAIASPLFNTLFFDAMHLRYFEFQSYLSGNHVDKHAKRLTYAYIYPTLGLVSHNRVHNA